MALVGNCPKRLDDINLRTILPKSHFAKDEIQWLDYKSGIKTLYSKTTAGISLKQSNALKNLRTFLGSADHLNKFIPNLAKLCHPLRPLRKKQKRFPDNWTYNHTIPFEELKSKITAATEYRHYNPNPETRLKCDALQQDLSAALGQLDYEDLKTVPFTTCLLNSFETRFF